MQVSASLLRLLLIAAAVSMQVLAQEDMKNTKEPSIACCFSFVARKIPLTILRDYQLTSGSCFLKAVIFKTRKNRRVCADPNQKWVQDAIKYLDDHSSP